MPWKSTVAKPPPPILSMYPFINFASGLSNPLFVFQVPFDVQSTVTPESPPVSSTMTPETGLMISPWEPFAPACALPPPALLFQFNWATSGKPAISSGPSSASVPLSLIKLIPTLVPPPPPESSSEGFNGSRPRAISTASEVPPPSVSSLVGSV